MTQKIIGVAKKSLDGISIENPALQDLAVDWVTKLLPKCALQTSLRKMHIILFDSHTKALPLKFLRRKVTQLTLLESTQHNASVQREFVARYLMDQQREPSSLKTFATEFEGTSVNYLMSSLLTAYHASAKDLWVPSKSKPYNERFLKKVFIPEIEFFSQVGVDEKEIETIAIGCLASPALQISLLRSLYKQLVVYLYHSYDHINKAENVKTERKIESIYNLVDFTLITFLHSTTFAHIICGKTDPIIEQVSEKSSLSNNNKQLSWLENTTEANLDFFAKSHRHFSFLFNLFFDVKLLNGWDGFVVDSFSPTPPEFKETKSLTEKLNKVGLKRNEFYAIQLRPRHESQLRAILSTVDINIELDVEQILQLIFWLTEMTTELRGSKLYGDELGCLFKANEISSSQIAEDLLSEKRLVKTVRPREFFFDYKRVRDIIADGILVSPILQQKYDAFRNQYLSNVVRDYVD